MSDPLKAIWREIRGTGPSPAKVSLIEEAIRLADSLNRAKGSYDLRMLLIDEANHMGQPEKMLTAFAWTLGQSDREPARHPEITLLWKYKWIVTRLRDFPQITRAQIEQALADFAMRLRRNGYSLRPMYSLDCVTGGELGDVETHRAKHELWREAKIDMMSDCRACDQHHLAWAEFFVENDREGLELARPILQGSLTCESIPHCTFAEVLLPLCRLGRFEEASDCHQKGYRLVAGQPRYLFEISRHIIYRALAGGLNDAATAMERDLRLAVETTSVLHRYYFFQACMFVLRRLVKSKSPKQVFQLPEKFALWNAKGQYDLCELAAWFEQESRALADQFDARAGNRFRRNELDAMNDLERLLHTSPAVSDSTE